MRTLLISLILPLSLIACVDKASEDDTGPGGGGDDTSSSGEEGGGEEGGGEEGGEEGSGDDSSQGTLCGTVTVELYELDEENERVEVSWSDYSSDVYNMGRIFVAAYQEDGDTELYRGTTAISSPTVAGDAYSIDVNLPDGDGEVLVYAQLDQHGDTILQTWDPRGVYPAEVEITDGDTFCDADIAILVDVSGWDSGGGGGGGGTGCTDVTISGDVTFTNPYASGGGVVMLTDSTGAGPYDWDFFTPTGDSSGATGSYSFTTCEGMGDKDLLGAIDTNGNELYDPDDAWGAYVSSPGVDGNPVSVGSTDLTGYDVEIPIEGAGLEVVPFVRISGDVSVDDGVFDDLPVGSSLYVAALKYRPTSDISVSDLESNSYDYDSYSWADLTGQTSVAYSVGVPANTVVYLWAYVDDDNDGVVNESGDILASGGTNTNGQLSTGSTSQTRDMELGAAVP